MGLSEFITQSPYSHVAMVLDEYHIIETDWKFPVSINHIRFKNTSYDIGKVDLTDEQKNKIKEYLISHIHYGYDFKLLFSHALHILFDFRITEDNTKFICSELINKAFKHAGVKLFDGFATPADLANSEKVKIIILR